MEFLSEYGMFLAKSVTLLLAILVVIVMVVAAGSRGKKDSEGELEVSLLNDKYTDLEDSLKAVVCDEEDLKQQHKDAKKKAKQEKKDKKKNAAAGSDTEKKRLFVLKFDGDVKASAVAALREEITAILTLATPEDEVVLCLESPGGMVHTYGLAASQLTRITQQDIPLTISVDAVAASGGYMMACIGTRILAAPFAIIGSIGVVAQLPNFHRLLKKNDIDFEMFTAGEYKRTVTMFGENTDKGKSKFVEELEDTHELFKSFVAEHRPQVNIPEVATGEIWYGKRALENNLIDDIQTSDEYLMSRRQDANIYLIKFAARKTLQEKLGLAAANITDGVVTKVWDRLRHPRSY